jgi:hypothetical protein
MANVIKSQIAVLDFWQSQNVYIIVKRFVLMRAQVRSAVGREICMRPATLLINVICHALIRKLAKRGRGREQHTQKLLIKFKPAHESFLSL